MDTGRHSTGSTIPMAYISSHFMSPMSSSTSLPSALLPSDLTLALCIRLQCTVIIAVPTRPHMSLASLSFFSSICQLLFPLGLRFPLETAFHFMILAMYAIYAIFRSPLSFHIAVPGQSPNKA